MVEQETCSSLEKCWNSNTELKTSREYGVGLGQLTIAYDKYGNERFNSFLEAKKKYSELASWRWSDRYNAVYQLTFVVLEIKSLYYQFSLLFGSEADIYAASFVGYNAGVKTVLNRLVMCRVSGCKSDTWFNGLEDNHLKNEEVLLYGQMLYLRRNFYPRQIIYVRAAKYENYFK